MPYCTWAPPESRMRIEYSTEVLRQISLEGAAREASGILFGTRQENSIRIVEARFRNDEGGADPAGLGPVGIFAARRRGEIFLTESDLKRFEQTAVNGTAGEPCECVALVVAGRMGGFFLRDNDGSIQTVRSYQEFPLAGLSVRRVRLRWSWVLLAGLVVTMIAAVLPTMLRAG